MKVSEFKVNIIVLTKQLNLIWQILHQLNLNKSI